MHYLMTLEWQTMRRAWYLVMPEAAWPVVLLAKEIQLAGVPTHHPPSPQTPKLCLFHFKIRCPVNPSVRFWVCNHRDNIPLGLVQHSAKNFRIQENQICATHRWYHFSHSHVKVSRPLLQIKIQQRKGMRSNTLQFWNQAITLGKHLKCKNKHIRSWFRKVLPTKKYATN